MKTLMKLSVSLIAVAILAGCSTTTTIETPTFKTVCGGMTLGFIGSDVTACTSDVKKIDERGRETGEYYPRRYDLVTSSPVLKDIARGATAGIGAAVIQGEYGKSISRDKRCEGSCNNTILAPSAYAGSNSYSQSNSGADVDIGGFSKYAE